MFLLAKTLQTIRGAAESATQLSSFVFSGRDRIWELGSSSSCFIEEKRAFTCY